MTGLSPMSLGLNQEVIDLLPFFQGRNQLSSLHFSHQLGASGLRIQRKPLGCSDFAIEGRSSDADIV